MKSWVYWTLLVVFCLGLVAYRAQAEGLTFLDSNPELKAKLLQWEKEAPPEVQQEI